MLALKWFFAILLIRTARVDAALDLGFGDDVDLTHFVTVSASPQVHDAHTTQDLTFGCSVLRFGLLDTMYQCTTPRRPPPDTGLLHHMRRSCKKCHPRNTISLARLALISMTAME